MSSELSGIQQYALSITKNAALKDLAKLGKTPLKIYAVASSAVPPDTETACKKGCAHCCHRLVGATLPEVLALAEVVRAWPKEEQEAWKSRVGQEPDFWKSFDWKQARPCPFLKNDECSVYEQRPAQCRAVTSFRAEDCKVHYTTGLISEPSTEAGSPYHAVLQGAIQGLKEAHFTSGLFELGPSVAALIENPDLDLSQANSPLNRLKAQSEWIQDFNTVDRKLAPIFQDPNVQEVVAAHRNGQPQRCREVLARLPDSPFKRLCDMILPNEYESQEQLDELWEQLGESLDRFAEYEGDSATLFGLVQGFNTFTWAYADKDIHPYLSKFGATLHRHASRIFPELVAPMGPRRPGKLRVGYICERLIKFNGATWAFQWLANHGPEIETFAFNLFRSEDKGSLCFRRQADHYYHLPLLAPDAAKFIRELDLDALIFTEIGMGGIAHQLAALRLARMQINSFGHPVTSGSPNVDVFVSSEWMEAPDGKDHYTEELFLLPKHGVCFPGYQHVQREMDRDQLGLPSGDFLMCPQVTMKFAPSNDALLAELSQKEGLPIVFVQDGPNDGKVSLDRMGRNGVNVFETPYKPKPIFFQAMQYARCVVDLPSWNGANTTVQALDQGVPIVTMPGKYMRSRHSTGLLRAAGVTGLIAKDAAEYVSIAHNKDLLQESLKNIDLDSVHHDPAPIAALDAFLLDRLS